MSTIEATFKVIWATTKVTLATKNWFWMILATEEEITASLKSMSATTKVILVTKKLNTANKKLY